MGLGEMGLGEMVLGEMVLGDMDIHRCIGMKSWVPKCYISIFVYSRKKQSTF
jgi:hypothetical protein